ncbi:unnamed protein product [marine sediment metagenome]|uniref:DUF4184 family protein n=1 Tax=marine sediment metagenome TaxID=412755 RepID=X1J834_9ZZZZ
MPNSLSHQAPGLLIKMKYPKRIDGTSICLSAFVPDLNVFFEPFMPFPFRHVTHSLLGLLIWGAPITILLTIIFSKYIGPRISEIAKKEGKLYRLMVYFGLDELHHLKRKQFNKRFYFVAFYSSLIGGFTHILLDLPAHRYNELFFPWALFLIPEILRVTVFEFNRIIPLYELIWFIEDYIFIGISLVLLRKIKKDSLIERWYNVVK